MPDRNAALIDYVSRLYPRPGVEPLLLRLQNEHDLDVLLLLAACWLGCSGRAAAVADWRAIAAWQAPWHQQVIAPLRAARVAVRGMEGDTTLYSQIKDCEQAAECLQHLICCCFAQGVVVNDALRAQLQELGERAARVG